MGGCAQSVSEPVIPFRVLVIEDDEATRSALVVTLEDEGFVVSSARNGEDGLLALATDPLPDAIVLDLMMPGVNGWQFRVRQRADERIANVPVLVLSADTSEQALAIHSDAYLSKPLRAADVVRAIRHLIAAKEARHARARLAQAERVTLVETVVAGIAHELDGPIASASRDIDQLCNRVLVDAESGPSAYKLDEAATLARGARDGVARIRAVSEGIRVAVLAPSVRRQRVALDRVVDLALEVAGGHLRSRARLVCQYRFAPHVLGNEAQLVQVALNLLDAAAQSFAPARVSSNTITVTIGAREDEAVLTVSHNGPALEPDACARLFEPIFATRAASSPALGLPICRRIVELHGGRIEVQSEPGEGMRFCVSFPAAPPDAQAR
jgi:C4-dicarboxylate-specific signal transduction histidine kinase